MPILYQKKIQQAIDTLVDNANATATAGSAWDFYFEKSGVRSWRQPGNSSICIRSECCLSFSYCPNVLRAFSILVDKSLLRNLNPLVKSSYITKQFSPNSWMEHFSLQQVM
jgi:hypothetical protein